jgi:DEAD/DEAH box helicase domain-containing protein
MNDNKIVFDIETKNTFFDIGGKRNIDKLEVSVVALYSYNDNEYRVFDENELDELGEILQKANPLIGFSSKQFDVPVLEKHYDFKLSAVPHFDIFEEIYKKLGRRIGLDPLAQANTNEKKSNHGLEAVKMYERGDIEELKAYCLQDVKVTKVVFDLIVEKGYLWVPKKGLPQMDKVEIFYEEPDRSQSSLI